MGFELEVKKTVELDNGEIFICKIRNTLVEEEFAQNTIDNHGPMPVNEANPVIGCGGGTFFKIGDNIKLK